MEELQESLRGIESRLRRHQQQAALQNQQRLSGRTTGAFSDMQRRGSHQILSNHTVLQTQAATAAPVSPANAVLSKERTESTSIKRRIMQKIAEKKSSACSDKGGKSS